MDRLATFGTALFTSPQAKPEPPKATAPAPAPKAAAAPAAKGPLAATSGYMPSQMISNVVSAKPQPAEAPKPQPWKTTPGIGGAAQMYASMAGGALESNPEVPKEGPAAVAVARSIEAGKAAVMKDGKLPTTSI